MEVTVLVIGVFMEELLKEELLQKAEGSTRPNLTLPKLVLRGSY
jgi:hypothetical protein